MSSEFDDFIEDAFDDAVSITGSMEVSIGGHSYFGLLDSYTGTKELQEGGFLPEYDATFMIKASDLLDFFVQPLERTLCKQILVVADRSYRIDRAVQDDLTLTLFLKA